MSTPTDFQVANRSSKPMNVDSQNFVGIPSQRLELVKELPFLKNCSLLKRCFEPIQNHLNPIWLVHLIDRKMLKFLFGIAGQRTIEQQGLVTLRSIRLHLNLPDANFLLIFCIGPKVILVILPIERWLWMLTRPPTDSRLRTFPWVPVCIIVLSQLSKCCNQRIAATSFPRGQCWSSSRWGFRATTWVRTSLSCRMMSNWRTYLGTKTLRGVISLGCCNARLNRWIMCQNFFLGLLTAFHVWRLTTTRLSSSSIPSSGRPCRRWRWWSCLMPMWHVQPSSSICHTSWREPWTVELRRPTSALPTWTRCNPVCRFTLHALPTWVPSSIVPSIILGGFIGLIIKGMDRFWCRLVSRRPKVHQVR